ncbi:MAG: transcriptional repressor LexA [Longimicrobiales bacterium]
MPLALNDMEQKILDYMVRYLRENTYQPSIREIGERFGIKSTKTVSEHLQALAQKGYLERDPSRSRGVRILNVDLNPQTVSVPCYGRMPSGDSGSDREGVETYLTLDRRLAGEKGAFFVRATNGDLAALGVSAGDYILLEPASAEQLGNGSLIVARPPDGSRPAFYRYALEDSSPSLKPLRQDEASKAVEDPSSLRVIGRVTAVYRKLDGTASTVSVTAH